MSISTELYREWGYMCAVLGRQLPINDIGPHTLSHVVAAGDPPIDLPDGAVRQLTLGYHYEDYQDEFPN
jgi:hypothetical protein